MPASKGKRVAVTFLLLRSKNVISIDVNNLELISLKSPLKMSWYWIKRIHFEWPCDFTSIYFVFALFIVLIFSSFVR